MNSLPNTKAKHVARELKRATVKEELVALTGNAIDALILNYFIKCQAQTKKIEDYIEEERQRLMTIGVDLNLPPIQGFFYKKASQVSEDTMLGLADSNMRKRIERLVENRWLVERDNPNIRWDKTKQFRVDVVLIHRNLRALGYHLDGWLIKEITRDDRSSRRPESRISETEIGDSETEIRDSESENRDFESQFRGKRNGTAYQVDTTSSSYTSNNNTRAARKNVDVVGESSSMTQTATPHSSSHAPMPYLTEEQRATTHLLVENGVWGEDAAQLAVEYSAQEIADQIAWYPIKADEARKSGKPFRNKGAMLAFLIRKGDPKPKQLQDAEAAKLARERAKQTAAENARQQAEADQLKRDKEKADLEEQAALDAQWEALSEDEKQALDDAITATHPKGDISPIFGHHLGQVAKMGMRRSMLRSGWKPPVVEAGPRYLGRDAKTEELQEAFEELDETRRQTIEERIGANFSKLGIKAGPDSTTWNTQRISLMRRMIDGGELSIQAKDARESDAKERAA